MKKIAFVLLLTITFHCTRAQSEIIKDIFRHLPADKLYGLTVAARDSILKRNTWYPADNDSSSILAYNYGVCDHEKDYMYVSMSYETAQRATGMIELRIFKTGKGEKLVIVSKHGGVWEANYHQQELSQFIYDSNKKLHAYSKPLFTITDERLFLKKGTPDSVKKIILNNSNLAFDFCNEKPTLALNSHYLSNSPIARKWLKGDRIEFTWTGDRFIVSSIGFDDSPVDKTD